MPVWTKKGRPRPKPSIFAGLTGPTAAAGVDSSNNHSAAATTTTTATTTTAANKGRTSTAAAATTTRRAPTTKTTATTGVKKTQPSNKTGSKVIDKKLENAGKTKILSLREHHLEVIPGQVFQIKTLKTLDVSHNRLRRLGNQLTDLTDLKSLNVDQNRLTPGTLAPIASLDKLQTLSAGGNKLGQSSGSTNTVAPLPPSLPASLKQIKLDHNGFAIIPRQLLQVNILPKLEKLDLSFNNLTTVPPEIGNLVALTQLDLDNNKITKLPTTIGKLHKLKALSLKNNQLRAPLAKAKTNHYRNRCLRTPY